MEWTRQQEAGPFRLYHGLTGCGRQSIVITAQGKLGVGYCDRKAHKHPFSAPVADHSDAVRFSQQAHRRIDVKCCGGWRLAQTNACGTALGKTLCTRIAEWSATARDDIGMDERELFPSWSTEARPTSPHPGMTNWAPSPVNRMMRRRKITTRTVTNRPRFARRAHVVYRRVGAIRCEALVGRDQGVLRCKGRGEARRSDW